MKHRPMIHDRLVELFDFRLASTAAYGKRDFPLFGFAIDHQPLGSLAHVASLAAHHCKSKKRLFPFSFVEMAVFAFPLPSESHTFLELLFLLGAANFS